MLNVDAKNQARALKDPVRNFIPSSHVFILILSLLHDASLTNGQPIRIVTELKMDFVDMWERIEC